MRSFSFPAFVAASHTARLAAILTASLVMTPAALAANSITSIAPSANPVTLVNGKAVARFIVSGDGGDGSDCGVWVNYGDEDSPDTRVVGRRDGPFPREFTHTFNRAGQFTVTARGERVKQVSGCGGAASTSINVVEPQSNRRRAASASACPDGWALREGSYNRQTGAFTCVPAPPAEQIDCGRGLRYFERDNTIGCRRAR